MHMKNKYKLETAVGLPPSEQLQFSLLFAALNGPGKEICLSIFLKIIICIKKTYKKYYPCIIIHVRFVLDFSAVEKWRSSIRISHSVRGSPRITVFGNGLCPTFNFSAKSKFRRTDDDMGVKRRGILWASICDHPQFHTSFFRPAKIQTPKKGL